MNRLALPLGLVLAGFVAGAAYAQPSAGEATPPEKEIKNTPRATPAEKAAAKANRKAMGAAAAKSHPGAGEAYPSDDIPMTEGKAHSATVGERKAAAVKRRMEVAPAVKRGEIPRGEQ
jgi:hypothetical protein